MVLWAMLAYAAQEQVTIRVPVRLVTAPTLVFTDDGRLLTDLKLSDFRLYDNERLQKIAVESGAAPVSVAVAVQTNLDVRAYVPFIAKVGSVVETMVAGEEGDSALLTYNSEVQVRKRFGSGDLQKELRAISPSGLRARSLDAGMQAVRMLAEQPPSRRRVLLLIGQALDDGSEAKLAALQDEAEKQNVAVFALVLPEIGKNFISDNFSLQGQPAEGGGFIASTNLLKLISVLSHAGDGAADADPFTALSTATAGGLFHFRKQDELESILAAVGVQLRSGYLLSYYANTAEAGKHKIRVEVDVTGANVRTRPEW
jgi:VWFA-related protein